MLEGSRRAKNFKLTPEQIRPLIPFIGRCIASDMITVGGLPVGYMCRETPEDKDDSGWQFFSGTETDDYMANPRNFAIYDVNTICNYDPAIIPYLKEPPGFEFLRKPGTVRFDRGPLKRE